MPIPPSARRTPSATSASLETETSFNKTCLITLLEKLGEVTRARATEHCSTGVSANLLYGFERFILQKVGRDVPSLNADVDEPYGLLSKAVRGAAGTGSINGPGNAGARFREAIRVVARAWYPVREPSYGLRRLSHSRDKDFAE